jgi:cell division protein FtsB
MKALKHKPHRVGVSESKPSGLPVHSLSKGAPMTSKILTASLLATVLAAGLAAAPAMAQQGPYPPHGVYAPATVQTPGVDNAQQAVSDRIRQGLQSGRITPSEARLLYRRDSDIQNREAAYKSDGRVTPQERQQLRNDIAQLSAEVERAIANKRTVAVAQPDRLGAIDSQQFNISRRIDEGMRSHRLSPQEAGRLQAREQAIERQEAAYRSDGVVTPQERNNLRAQLTALRDEVERLINPRG